MLKNLKVSYEGLSTETIKTVSFDIVNGGKVIIDRVENDLYVDLQGMLLTINPSQLNSLHELITVLNEQINSKK